MKIGQRQIARAWLLTTLCVTTIPGSQNSESLGRLWGLQAGSERAVGGEVGRGSCRAWAPPPASTTPFWLETGLSGLWAPSEETLIVPWSSSPLKPDPSFARQPLAFERNDGQVDSEVKYLARGQGYTLFLTETEAVMALSHTGTRRRPKPGGDEIGPESSAPNGILRMRLVGANSSSAVLGEKELRGKVNYFIGNIPSLWRTNIPTFARVRYQEVYPGIDLIYYGNEGQLEYDWIVAPGADPNRIALEIEGADKLELNEAGDLVLGIRGEKLLWRKPLVYQELNGIRTEVAGRYLLTGADVDGSTHRLRFAVNAYDPTRNLVIDPALVWGTFLGGSDERSRANSVALDPRGNLFVSGPTWSAHFPTKNALQPTQSGTSRMESYFLTKLDQKGEMIYSTYIGPISCCNGPEIAVDSAGSAYLGGNTTSSDFPVKNAFQPTYNGDAGYPNQGGDAVVLKLTPDGSELVYSTYLGGRSDEGVGGIVVDSAGSAYVVGSTGSADFPLANPLQGRFGGISDAFVAKLNPTGTALVYSTYLGGSKYDYATSIAIGEDGSAYVVGATAGNFPSKNPLQPSYRGGTYFEGFFSKVSPSGGALVFSSYFGGKEFYFINAVAVGKTGDVYLAGETSSPDMPLVNALQEFQGGNFEQGSTLNRDGFIARYNPASNALVFSTYLGGSGATGGRGWDSIAALALDSADNAYVVGYTESADFPMAEPLQSTYVGGSDSTGYSDGFVSVLKADGSKLLYSSFLGGSGGDYASAVALAQEGSVFVAGTSGNIAARGPLDFPIDNPVLPNPGFVSAFVAKFTSISLLPPLKVVRSRQTVLISWPASITGAILEMTASLPAQAWAAVQTAPIQIGDQELVTLDITSGNQFFRLRK